MDQIRYKQRICSDQNKIDEFLLSTRTGVISMGAGEYPYAIPVNFIWKNGSIYFHGMGSGKKYDILLQQPKVCFSVYQEFGTVTDPVPCHADTSYFSVLIFGEARKVNDFQEGAEVLELLLDKFMPGFYSQKISSHLVEKYRSSMDNNPVGIFCIDIKHITAKENAVSSESLYKM